MVHENEVMRPKTEGARRLYSLSLPGWAMPGRPVPVFPPALRSRLPLRLQHGLGRHRGSAGR
jgi:hypothetical protein